MRSFHWMSPVADIRISPSSVHLLTRSRETPAGLPGHDPCVPDVHGVEVMPREIFAGQVGNEHHGPST